MPKRAAYFNHGRWVIDCPCMAGVLVEPGDKTARCLACGKQTDVKWPAPQSRAAAEKLLASRPVENRNWFPDRETVADLRAENKERGVK